MNKFYPLLFLIVIIWTSSCEREDISSSPSLKLSFSNDTVMFDTVFTTFGSSTRYFKVYNRNSHDLKISSIKLAGGETSAYKVNIDGAAASSVNDIVLRSDDSLFVFVKVKIDPNSQNSPLVVADSVIFETNGNLQNVNLIAWGQDVHLFNADSLMTNTTFIADKPYLIYDYLHVKPNVELEISAGAKIYFHNNAHLLIGGTLRVNGEFDNPVIFKGDRLEDFYRDKAGQWGGILLYKGSKNNSIKWAEISCAINGIIVDTCYTPGTPTLTISNTKVENVTSAGLFARGSTIEADNCLFSNAGQVSVALTIGGNYKFFHCTIVNYWGSYTYRKGPALLFSNYFLYKKNGDSNWTLVPRDMEQASFYNCIIYGSREQEYEVDNTFEGQTVNALMNYNFDHCILKVPSNFSFSDPVKFNNVLNKDPKFKDPWKLNFQLDTLSPAKDYGKLDYGTLFPVDLKNISHLLDSKPDLGAYERKE